MDAALIVLIVFICLIAIGLATYLTIFFIQRSYFKKYKKQVEKYNDLREKLNSINFYRLDVLTQNKMLDQQKFIQLKNNYETLKANTHTIYLDLMILAGVVKSMDWKAIKKTFSRVISDIERTVDESNIFLDEFNKNTQYSNEIEDALQVSMDLFNALKKFYYKDVIYHANFKPINDLIDLIEKSISAFSSSIDSLNFDAIVKCFIEIHGKLKALWRAIDWAIKMQFIDVYLQTAKESNEALLAKSKVQLAFQDLEYIQKANNIYLKYYEAFKNAYLSFDIKKTNEYAVKTAKEMANISNFCFIHASATELISESLKVINEQTSVILNNKQKILNSINDLASYFAKDIKTFSYFSQIDNDVKAIESLHNQANNVKTLSTDEKIKALKQLSKTALSIIECKNSIKSNVEHINYTLGRIISLLTQLNELYTYHIQMLPTIKILANDNPVRNEFISLLNNNIVLIKSSVNDIITNPNPDFKEISARIVRMIEETQKVKEKINSTVILKSYANKLLQYVNRYKNAETITLIEKAEEEYRAKNYTQCLDTLILICKRFK